MFDDTDDDPDYLPNQEQNEAFAVDYMSNNGENSEIKELEEFDRPIEQNETDILDITWGPVTGNLNSIIYNPDNVEVNSDVIETMFDSSPIDFYHLFFDEEVLDLLVIETNRYAQQKLRRSRISPYSHLRKWHEVDRTEIRIFLRIVLWMGLVKMPSLRDYWRRDFLYSTRVPNVMSRNKFKLILFFSLRK